MNTNTPEEIKPCPFCGGEAELQTIGNDYAQSRSVEIKCTSCYTKQITGAIRQSLEWCKETAIEKWNKRPASPSPSIPQPQERGENVRELAEQEYPSEGEDSNYCDLGLVQQDAFINGYCQRSAPQVSAEEIEQAAITIINVLDDMARDYDSVEYGLPLEAMVNKMRKTVVEEIVSLLTRKGGDHIVEPTEMVDGEKADVIKKLYREIYDVAENEHETITNTYLENENK
jgi:Lar family restriction alleviation protein